MTVVCGKTVRMITAESHPPNILGGALVPAAAAAGLGFSLNRSSSSSLSNMLAAFFAGGFFSPVTGACITIRK